MTFVEYAARFITKLEKENSIHTAQAYKNGLRVFNLFLVERLEIESPTLPDLYDECLVEFRDWMIDNNYAAKTRTVNLAAVNQFVKWANWNKLPIPPTFSL